MSILVQFVGPGRGVVRLVGVEDPEGVSRVFGEEEREEDRSNQERSRWGGEVDLEGGGAGIDEEGPEGEAEGERDADELALLVGFGEKRRFGG